MSAGFVASAAGFDDSAAAPSTSTSASTARQHGNVAA